MSGSMDALLDYLDLSFNKEDMLICHCHVEVDPNQHEVFTEWLELSVHEGTLDNKFLVSVDCCNLGETLQNCRKLLIHEVMHHCKVYGLTDGGQKRNLVNEEIVTRNYNILISR